MDKKYIELFKELAQSTVISAEQVMEYDKEKNDEQGYATAEMMRANYTELLERIKETKENYTLDKPDAAKLVVAALIIVNQLQGRIEALKRAMSGYQTDVIPKLQAVVDTEDDEAAIKIAEEKFVIENKE